MIDGSSIAGICGHDRPEDPVKPDSTSAKR